MARGYPDYSRSVGTTEEGQFLQQLAEPPIWFEDKFDTPTLKWSPVIGTVQLTVASADATNSSGSYTNEAGLYMKADVGDYFTGRCRIGTPPTVSRLGVKLEFMIGEPADYKDGNGSFWPIEILYHSGTRLLKADVGYNPHNGVWAISSDGGATWDEITTLEMRPHCWHSLKVVIDFVGGKFITLRINATEVDISTYDTGDIESDAPNSLYLYIIGVASAGKQAEAWIDNYKVTYGEI